jgi:hypothetical protein
MFQVYPRGSRRRVSNSRQYYDFRVVSESAPRKALSHHKGSLSAQTAARKLARKYGPTRVQVATHGSGYWSDAFPGHPSFGAGRQDNPKRPANRFWPLPYEGRAANPGKGSGSGRGSGRSRLYDVTVPPTASERGYQFTIRARTAGAALQEARRYCALNAGMPVAGYKLPRGSSARVMQTR